MDLSQRSRRAFAAMVVAGALLLTPATHAAVRPPRLEYTMTTLPNGMGVVFLEDHSTPIVHLEVWYHVGSKNERPGRTGFAHFFEHMMFKGSKNVEPEGHPSYISSVGGQSNAYTNEDATVFWETVPSQYLPLVLWLEADRMASLKIEEKAFKNEREVVKEERRMRIENQPYGRLQEIIADQTFTVHPYKHPVIGSMKDLDAASVDDVREFFQTYYAPNNATAVLVAVAIVQPGHTTEEAASALVAELDRLRTEPVSSAELQQAKNQFARDYLLQRESNQNKAEQLGHAVVIHHDIKTADDEFDIFQRMTVADVQRVARTYFTPENRTVITILPKGTRP